jgi:hypothetical protein
MEAVRASETSVHSNDTTRSYIWEDSKLSTHHRENLKSHMPKILIEMPEETRTLAKPRHRWEDDDSTGLKETLWKVVDWMINVSRSTLLCGASYRPRCRLNYVGYWGILTLQGIKWQPAKALGVEARRYTAVAMSDSMELPSHFYRSFKTKVSGSNLLVQCSAVFHSHGTPQL